MLTIRTYLIFALLAAAVAGCSGPVPKWYEVRSDHLSQKEVHEKCLFVLAHSELRVDESDLDGGTIITKWEERLFPFYRPSAEGGGGYRRRAHVEIREADIDAAEARAIRAGGAEMPKTIRVRVERERNAEKNRPAEPALALWEPQEDDIQLASRLAALLQNQLMEFKPSDDFYRRFGGAPATAPSKK